MTEASERLRVWIRDFGHEKQPAFIADLTAVLDELDLFRHKLSDFSQQQYEAARAPRERTNQMTEPYLTPERIDAGKVWLWSQRSHDEAMYARTYIEVLENERDELRERLVATRGWLETALITLHDCGAPIDADRIEKFLAAEARKDQANE